MEAWNSLGQLTIALNCSLTDGRSQLSENDQQKRLDSLVWNKTEKLLGDAGSDVLEIFDW